MLLFIIDRQIILKVRRVADAMDEKESVIIAALFQYTDVDDFLHDFQESLFDLTEASLEDLNESVDELLSLQHFQNKYAEGTEFHGEIHERPWRLIVKIKEPKCK